MLARAARLVVLAIVGLTSAGCSLGGSSEETSATETGETTTVAERAASELATCQLVSAEEAGEILGVSVAPLEQAPTPNVCELTSPTRQPVLGVRVERGQTPAAVQARIDASGDTVERIDSAAGDVTWSAARSIGAALYEDAFVQVVLPPTSTVADRRAGALAILERVVARVAALMPEETFEQAARSYEDNVLARAEAGEWSVEEGVVETLRLLAGDADEAEVLRTTELDTFETTGLLAMARELEESASDAAVRDEISELRGRLSFTRAELDGISRPATRTSASAAEPSAARRQLAATLQAPVDCDDFYGEYAVPAGVDTCLLVHEQTTGGVSFRIYEPDLADVDLGWADAFVVPAVTLVRETIDETVEQTFLSLGSLPPEMLVVLAASRHHRAAMQAVPGEDGASCTVTLFLGAQKFAPSDFKQLLAHELAHCFQNATFPGQQVAYEDRRWREEGLAEYVSAVAYPEVNVERRFVDLLRKTEIATATVLSRAYENVVWFHFLRESLGGDAAIMDLVRGGPTSGTIDDQQGYLAAQPEIEERHHAFTLATTDGTVRDLDGSTYPPSSSANTHGEELAEGMKLTAQFRPLGVGRFVFTVPAGMAANLEIVSGDEASVSARPFESPGDWFGFRSGDELLAPCDEDARFVLVASSASLETAFTLEVTTLEEYDCEECVVGEWRLELPEPFLASTGPFLNQPGSLGRTVSGAVDLSIFDDGSIDVAIDGYEEVIEFDLYELRTTSRGTASGRWEIENGQLRAGYEFDDLETTFATTGVGFEGTQNVPPIHTLVGRPGPYTCDEQRLVYANPDGPIVSYRRR